MSGNKYLADTNAFILLLSKHPSLESLQGTEWMYSFVTEIELLSKPDLSLREEKAVQNLLAVARKVPHLEAMDGLAIEIRKKFRLKIPDAIIAATSVLMDMPLITADTDFLKVSSLDIVFIDLEQ